MTQIMVGRTITDKDLQDKEYKFVVPDMMKLMNTPVRAGDEIIIPVSMRDNEISFWESGGRNPNTVASVGTIIANSNDQLLDAILFNKLNKIPNGKQALIGIKPGYHIYAGKISVRHNPLDPKIKIILLTYEGVSREHSNETTTFGIFTVKELFTDYNSIRGRFPAERLVDKLFAKNVVKPYFANGWSISNIAGIKQREALRDAYLQLMNIDTNVKNGMHPNKYLDAIEDAIVSMNNQKLSAAFQLIDFETGMMSIKPLSGIGLSDILGTISEAIVTETFSISLSDMTGCYNQNLMFNSSDIGMLEKALMYDEKYAINLGDRKYGICRGFRG